MDDIEIEMLNKYTKGIIDIVKKTKAELKNKRSKPEEEEEKEEEEEVKNRDFVCVGRVWEEPIAPCQGGERSHISDGIIYNKKRLKVCRECSNARERFKNKQKKAKKDEE